MTPELVLGTVQFGLRYGIAGRDAAVPPGEARAILARAAALGIRLLDTAAAYGDIESRLAGLMGDLRFEVASKIPPRPAGLEGGALEAWAGAQVRQSVARLGTALRAIMFHRAEDLLEGCAPALWHGAAAAAAEHGLTLGVSCYDLASLRRVGERYPVALAQLPGNAFDQGLLQARPGLRLPEIHLRSAFLQGLLLMPEADAGRKLPVARGALARWHEWCRVRGLAPVPAALGIVKALPGVRCCVVGVDNVTQLEAIGEAWQLAAPLHAPELALDDPEIIDPRRWKVAA